MRRAQNQTECSKALASRGSKTPWVPAGDHHLCRQPLPTGLPERWDVEEVLAWHGTIVSCESTWSSPE